jgi:biopolymer transport protein ExbD
VLKKARLGSRPPAAGINITPLIDILLVLLVIFMTSASKPSTGVDAVIPQPGPTPPEEREAPLILRVDADGGIELNEAPVIGKLKNRLEQILKTRHDRTVFLNADSTLPFETIAHVIDESTSAGAARVGLMTEQAGVMP